MASQLPLNSTPQRPERLNSLPVSLEIPKGDVKRASASNFLLSPNSLNNMISRTAALREAHARFLQNYRKSYSQEHSNPGHCEMSVLDLDETESSYDDAAEFYGYGDAQPDQGPSSKKRRFERRCSKTPRMLMSMSASVLSLMDDDEPDENSRMHRSEPNLRLPEEGWDDGLEIAQELVKQLQHRETPSRTSSCSSQA